jgi:hypothetical protein
MKTATVEPRYTGIEIDWPSLSCVFGVRVKPYLGAIIFLIQLAQFRAVIKNMIDDRYTI